MAIHPAEHYRWMLDSDLAPAATVTICTGTTEAAVLAAFGSDPALGAPVDDLDLDVLDPWVRTLEVGGGVVVAVEPVGWQGWQAPVLARASATGVAAGAFWDVEAMTGFGAARAGVVLARFEPGIGAPPGTGPRRSPGAPACWPTRRRRGARWPSGGSRRRPSCWPGGRR